MHTGCISDISSGVRDNPADIFPPASTGAFRAVQKRFENLIADRRRGCLHNELSVLIVQAAAAFRPAAQRIMPSQPKPLVLVSKHHHLYSVVRPVVCQITVDLHHRSAKIISITANSKLSPSIQDHSGKVCITVWHTKQGRSRRVRGSLLRRRTEGRGSTGRSCHRGLLHLRP